MDESHHLSRFYKTWTLDWTMDWIMDWIMDSILDLILDQTTLCMNLVFQNIPGFPPPSF